MARAASTHDAPGDEQAATRGPVTRDDLENKLREVYDGTTAQVASTRSTLVSVAAVVGALVVLIVFLLGIRGGKKRTTIVEIKRV